eukprot:TRINITY_DN3260_c0_g2_i7.p1 TRINITY_DN3260_c0_g2~~TRINITY_DN3260_c0_g2_i7.p1  ORF type:complete len:186 (-),score=33.33 TRINITY_DN3260_c0_g2_i7:343-900(-)
MSYKARKVGPIDDSMQSNGGSEIVQYPSYKRKDGHLILEVKSFEAQSHSFMSESFDESPMARSKSHKEKEKEALFTSMSLGLPSLPSNAGCDPLTLHFFDKEEEKKFRNYQNERIFVPMKQVLLISSSLVIVPGITYYIIGQMESFYLVVSTFAILFSTFLFLLRRGDGASLVSSFVNPSLLSFG